MTARPSTRPLMFACAVLALLLFGCASADNDQRRAPPGADPDTSATDPGATLDAAADPGSATEPDPGATPEPDPGATPEPDTPTPDPGPETLDPGPETLDPGTDPGPPAPDVPLVPCNTEISSDLTGVTIEITTSACTWTLEEAAAGLKIGYQVKIDEEVTGVVPMPQDAGGCGKPDETGLIVFPRDETPTILQAGTFPKVFEWDGREFQGPSDTGFQPGDPFPPGAYTLSLKATGRWEDAPDGTRGFEVLTTFVVNLVP